jgi:hypothetical protein
MKTEFDNLRLNPRHSYESDRNGEKQTVKIYRDSQLIAKKITLKKSIRYFAITGYTEFIIELPE